MMNNKFRFYETVGAIAKHLEELENWQELTRYEVSEHFGDKPVKTFNFINLKADVEDGGIYFSDAEETIYNTNSVLLGFLEDSVMSAYFSIPIKGQTEIRIILKDGYVDILAHCDYEIEEDEVLSDIELDELYKDYYSQPDCYDY